MSVLDAILEPKLAAEGLRPRDGVADMTHISDIDVDGINENLLVRYKRDEIYTFTGSILVAVNPYKFLPIYETENMQMYSGHKMGVQPPHIFATAEAAYRNVTNSDQNQSCIISGESGAGKTETTKFILQYLCSVSTSVTKWVEQQILEANVVLESFGNARTVRNDNSSRFGKFMQVCFDEHIEIKGMIIQEYLLEQSRITFQARDERNYHVFYQLTKGADKDKYLLQPLESYEYLNQSGCYSLDDVDDRKSFEELCMALQVLNVDETLMEGIFSLVSAVLLVGNLRFESVDDGEGMRLTKDDKTIAAKIARLLQLAPEQVEEVLTVRQIIVRGTVTTIPLKLVEARENRHAMAKAMYSRCFTWLIDKINQTTNPGDNTNKFIGVLDIFGFENFAVNSFEQLCINFTNEKLHKFFNHYVFAIEQAEYEKEEIDFAHISFSDNTPCLELIEKPPICVLRLLDEECRIPKGSDTSYIEKQHDALSNHPNYAKGENKSRWGQEFGIIHFAGEVSYTVNGFLDKNRDVMQDMFFEYLSKSEQPFVRDITRFQDMLTIERKVIMGNKLRRNDSIMMGRSSRNSRSSSSSLDEGMRTNKSKPTVGDAFRRQLGALVEVLDNTTPWYVRCIKPNAFKQPGKWNDELVVTQLKYSGMLDIVRIRKEGFPVHVPHSTFVNKYHAMAHIQGHKLHADPKEACKQILNYVKAPTTEWQIGKTKVFLRTSVFDPLEDKIRSLLHEKVVKIQAAWRGHHQKNLYKEKKLSIVRIQAAVRGAAVRLHYLQHRRAAVKIQSAARGWAARELVKEIRAKKKAEEERRRKEEQAQREAEARAKGEAMMEESFLQAQKELFAMAKMAELQANEGTAAAASQGSGSAVNLDSMFTSLATDADTAKGKEYVDQIENELGQLFDDAPKVDGKRTMRRKKRVQKKVIEFEQEEEAMKHREEVFDPAEYTMVKFAMSNFNSFPKADAGTFNRRGTYKKMIKGEIEDPMPKEEMVVWSKGGNLPTSLTHLHNPENVNLACSLYKDLNKHMKGDLKPEQSVTMVQTMIEYCIERPELRNEVFCQLIKQTTNNPKTESAERGWQVLAVMITAFPPGKALFKFLQSYLKVNVKDAVFGGYARYGLDALRQVRNFGPRRAPCSAVEIEAIQTLQPIICRFYFLDGKAKAVGIQPYWTAADVIEEISDKIGLRNHDGWALFESTPQSEHFIRSSEYLADLLAEWERQNPNSVQMSKYQTMSRRGSGSGFTSAMGGGDAKFVFRKRLFKNPREIPKDPVEYSLLYAQAVHTVVRVDAFPVNEKVSLQLAGLQSQVLWGDADADKISRYEQIETLIPFRIRSLARNRPREEWMQLIYNAHKEFGSGKSDMQAKVLYLTAVKQYPLYGGTFFDVIFKGFWSFPSRVMLGIHHDGFKFVNPKAKDVLAQFPYELLLNIEVNAYEDTITLNMVPEAVRDGSPSFYVFQTPRKDDVANLIASYSPAHRNWKQVGLAPVNRRHLTEDDKSRLLMEVQRAREELIKSDLLLPPPQENKGFLATTLRRYSSKKLDRSHAVGGNPDFEKAFPPKFWSYSKVKITQPLTRVVDDDSTQVAMVLFNSLLVYAGLLREGGFELENDPNNVALLQNSIGRCLEKEDMCNEFYMQLIKQTTDQPDPNSRVNIQNWRFMALTLGIVVPRMKPLLRYLEAHLRRCTAEAETEEGKYAQFCLQCLQRTLENKNRKYPPSSQEVLCVVKRAPIYARFHFMDGEFRALVFDAAAITGEVVTMVKERVGLPADVQGFSLFEVFGSLERNMLPWEKVADAMFKWEKYARSTHSQKELRLTFKKRLFLAPHKVPKHPVEFDLIFHQAMDDVRSDRFPITNDEAAYLAALRAQVELGDYDEEYIMPASYSRVVDQYMPKHLRNVIDPSHIVEKHKSMRGKDKHQCNVEYLEFIMSWEYYGCTIFEVLQSYTTTLPKNLWLAVNERGVHILRRRSKEPLISYSYRHIVNYSPSLRSLLLVTESLTRGTKFVFTTSQASQIAHLIKDYTHIIIERKKSAGGGKAQAAAAK